MLTLSRISCRPRRGKEALASLENSAAGSGGCFPGHSPSCPSREFLPLPQPGTLSPLPKPPEVQGCLEPTLTPSAIKRLSSCLQAGCWKHRGSSPPPFMVLLIVTLRRALDPLLYDPDVLDQVIQL